MIQYVCHDQIDRSKWDACLHRADTSELSFDQHWLDIVCPNWDALVWNDYETIFPLPVKSKYGIPYIMQPMFSQQLGMTGKGYAVSMDDFLEKIPSKYWRIRLALNAELVNKKYNFQRRLNCKLSLEKSAEELYSNFSSNTKRNIKKSKTNELNIQKISVDTFIEYKILNAEENEFLGTIELLKNISGLEKIDKYNINIYGVFSNTELIAGAYLCQYKNELNYLSGFSSDKGRNDRAMFFMFNYLIEQHANSPIALNFKGSYMPSIMRFFKGFGGEESIYFIIDKYKWPWMSKIWK